MLLAVLPNGQPTSMQRGRPREPAAGTNGKRLPATRWSRGRVAFSFFLLSLSVWLLRGRWLPCTCRAGLPVQWEIGLCFRWPLRPAAVSPLVGNRCRGFRGGTWEPGSPRRVQTVGGKPPLKDRRVPRRGARSLETSRLQEVRPPQRRPKSKSKAAARTGLHGYAG